jgi:GAF domain-containing protein
VNGDDGATRDQRARDRALEGLVASVVLNVPGVDFVSITLREGSGRLRTVTATDPLAERCDAIQYEFLEGPCYDVVTIERFAIVNDLAASNDYPRYGVRAAELGMQSQCAIQLVQDGASAGLNLYARKVDAFDRSTVHLAELFATQAAVLLEFAVQVEQLSTALHTRTDIGIAVGIVMERYGVDRDRAFAFLLRNSNDRNVKLREVARHIIDGTFLTTRDEDSTPTVRS